MTFKHQGMFKENAVPQVLQRLRDSEQRRHAKAIASREALRTLFGGDWFAPEEAVSVQPDEVDATSAALNSLSTQDEAPASSHMVTRCPTNEFPVSDLGLFACEPSYLSSSPEALPMDSEALPLDLLCPRQQHPSQASQAESGVNAKIGRSTRRGRPLSTPGRAGLIANFHLSQAEPVVAISELNTKLDHHNIESQRRTDAFIQKLTQEYQGRGKLPDWAKFVTPEMKQFFRIFLLCNKPDAKTITIRLDHETAEAALASPRSPANYLGEIIKRTFSNLGVETDLAFNIEFNHTERTENHPAHIHGTLCIPDHRVNQVTEALRSALGEGYRQRYNNLAVHIEKPRSARSWAAYCIKEYDITGIKLTSDRRRKTRPEYSTQKLTQDARVFYENISAWLGE